jgi:hypothetical protein
MGHAHGFMWNADVMHDVRDMKISGLSFSQIADKVNAAYPGAAVSRDSAKGAWMRYHSTLDLMERREDVPTYITPELPDDDYMVSCDYHAPYHSELWINRLLMIADKFKIKKHIIIGDLFDMSFASFYRAKDGEKRPSLDEESNACAPVFRALDYFDQNILINGNHEARIGNLTDSKIEARHLFGYFGAEVWEKKFKYYTQAQMDIGKEWTLVHPDSYSQVSASVAVRLAEKFHRNVINAHGHFCAMRFDRSGKYICIDGGGMFDRDRVAYIHTKPTTHPFWNNSFVVLKNGKPFLFHDLTDWHYWLA